MVTDGAAALALRPATAADLPALAAFDRLERGKTAASGPAHMAGWLDPEPERYLRGWVEAGQCHLAEVGGALAGYGVLHYHFFHAGFIDLVIVGGAHRRRGIGRAMVRHFVGLCEGPKVWVSTNLSNAPMQRLLAAEGFRMRGFIEGLDEGDPELVYSKPRQA